MVFNSQGDKMKRIKQVLRKWELLLDRGVRNILTQKDEPYNSADQQIPLGQNYITSVLTHYKKHYFLKFGDQGISKHLFHIFSEKKFFSTS